jgi:hypothetical protein
MQRVVKPNLAGGFEMVHWELLQRSVLIASWNHLGEPLVTFSPDRDTMDDQA